MDAASSIRPALTPPVHIALIMDGNGRWAKRRGLPRFAGHQQGAESVRTVVRSCRELGIRFVTLYAFSSENWKRPASEVDDLMGLLRLYVRRERDELVREGVRVRFIGDRTRLAPDIQGLLDEAEQRTAGNSLLTVCIALNYGSRSEIVDAARRIARQVAAGLLAPDAVDEATFQEALDTRGIPDPDLVIRTSGEQRLSNFLLWQSAYAELIFTPTLWPDFSRADLEQAISEYHRRERRYGTTSG
ncbi:MAG: isoprenyl transferase [Alphaproteobacteria bacterium]|nr:isoprenyl transferase [Alphaproteobacteria bacterium]